MERAAALPRPMRMGGSEARLPRLIATYCASHVKKSHEDLKDNAGRGAGSAWDQTNSFVVLKFS